MHARPDQHRRGAELHIAKCGSIIVCEADLYTLKLSVSSFYMFKEA